MCNLGVYYQNARSLHTKAAELFANIGSSCFAIVVLNKPGFPLASTLLISPCLTMMYFAVTETYLDPNSKLMVS